MSSGALISSPHGVLAGWESERQVYFGRVLEGTNKVYSSVVAPGSGHNRKYPALALNARDETLLVPGPRTWRGKRWLGCVASV